MKKPILILFLTAIYIINIQSQTGQFAVVKPNGSTLVYSSWSAAYGGAANGDYVYLPGVTIPGTITIDKKLYIYGTGHDPDSATATGRTIFSQLNILSGASGGSIEGINASGLTLGSANRLHDYLIKRCCLANGNLIFTSTSPDSLPQNITITESIFSIVYTSNGINGYAAKYCYFIKNIINFYVNYFESCTFKNNDFLDDDSGNYTCTNISNSLFENNIFLSNAPLTPANFNCNNIYINNLKTGDSDFSHGQNTCPVMQSENISVPSANDIFMYYGNNSYFNYSNNYHLKPTCPGVGAGTDGTDVGIYGTINPTVEGWIPSNPHIFFKQVDPETGPDGKLHIQVGVRANNN